MVAFWIQVLLLMGASYFLGAALGCALRRSLYRDSVAVVGERRVDPLPEVAKRSAEPASFGRVPETAPRPAPRPAAVATPLPAPAPAPAPAQPVAQAAAQDLKRIRLIDTGVESALNRHGIKRYEQIAAWTTADLLRAAEAIGVSRARINQENWIEQAQVLAKGGETHYSARRARGEGASAAPTPDQGEAPAPEPPSPQPLPRPMSRAGVAAVVVTPPEPTPLPAPQPAAAPTPPPAPPTAAAPPPSPPLVAERAAFAVPVRPTPAPERDNLRRIGTISEDIERTLNGNGVLRYAQIAQWSPAEVERFDKLVGGGGRIARENWIEQAQILSRGGDTRFSREYDGLGRISDAPPPRPIKLPDAIREHEAAKAAEIAAPAPEPAGKRTGLGALRSVQALGSAQEPGPEAAKRAADRTAGITTVSAPNDLKRIRGIGVLIEKKLNSMGVNSYDQIANWTADDIEHFSSSLDFKGRIERENWVEQARILASGGSTEFSRRVDRGEVETGRTKV
jgi:predicted flap endonuclease-1-like 5' DNA nuclease